MTIRKVINTLKEYEQDTKIQYLVIRFNDGIDTTLSFNEDNKKKEVENG